MNRFSKLIHGALLLAVIMMAGTVAGSTGWSEDRPPVTIVTNGWVDVRDILRNVAANSDLGLQMAPDVTGKVNVHLQDVAVDRALDALLVPADLGYEVVDDVLVVYKRGMVTHWINFDYPVTEREGRGELEISASGGGESGGSGGESGTNKSHVTSTAIMSIWPGVMESLKVMVFKDSGLIQSTGGSGGSGGSGGESAVNLTDSEGRTLVVHPMAGMIMVTAEWNRVNEVEQLLGRLEESLLRQVSIEVRIMEVYLNDETQTGINWNILDLTSDISSIGLNTLDAAQHITDDFFQFTLDSKHMAGVLEAISTSGEINTVSTPKITTLNNQKAVVRIVTEEIYYESTVEPAVISNGVATDPVINYTARNYPVGVVLDVTPQVGQDRVITLNVHPTISDIVGIAESPNSDTAPILSVRELDTVGKVKDGETLVIAGLMSERTNQRRTGIPILKDLPLLKYIFGKTSDKKVNIELVMLLTPVIMDGGRVGEMAKADQTRLKGKM
jgi:MSHA biogenesis protein MshL